MKHIGLVTPPSPRSLSSDSNRPRRRRSGGSKRGRSRQRSRSESGEREGEADTDTDTTLASEDASPNAKAAAPSASRSLSPAENKDGDDEEEEEDTVLGVRSKSGAGTLATPESSVYKLPTLTTSTTERTEPDDMASKAVGTHAGDLVSFPYPLSRSPFLRHMQHIIHMQTVIGVLVLGVAAAAVLWRVKPET